MTRQLPWKRRGVPANAGPNPPPRPPDSPARPGARASPPVKAEAGLLKATVQPERGMSPNARKTGARHGLERGRSPSTSPPPAPPIEQFMIEGIENDDKYRMVEDELLTTANTFTAHLHRAEYERLKQLARVQNAETIKHISRPVTGNMTDIVRRRQTGMQRAAKQSAGLKRARARIDHDEDHNSADDDDDDEYNSPWAGTALQGLMASPRKGAMPLTTLTSVTGGTRAAAGFVRSSPSRPSRYVLNPQRTTDKPPSRMSNTASSDDDTDDLDGVPTFDPYKGTRNVRTGEQSVRLAISAAASLPRSQHVPKQSAVQEVKRPIANASTRPSLHPMDDEGNEEVGDFDPSGILRRARERRERDKARRAARNNRGDKKEREEEPFADIVPSFL